MITTVVIEKVEDKIPPPTGNGFPVHAHKVYGIMPPWRVDSGLGMKIPKGYPLRLESAGKFIITGWSVAGGRLMVLVEPIEPGFPSAPEVSPEEGELVATAWVGQYERVPIRFVERPQEGGRVIRGDAKVVDCTESGDAESGEQVSN